MTVLVLNRQRGRSQKLEGDKFASAQAFARNFRQTTMPNVNNAGTRPSTLEFDLTFLVLNCRHCFEQKLEGDKFANAKAFARDFRLVFQNTKQYNSEADPVYKVQGYLAHKKQPPPLGPP